MSSIYFSVRLDKPYNSCLIKSSQVKSSHFTTDGQSVSMSWCRAQSGTSDQRFFFFKVTVLSYLGRPLRREVGSVICQSFVIIVCSSISMHIQFTLCVTHSSQLNTIKYNRIKNLHCVIHIYSKR
jgi:hypothetical protein